MIEVRIQPQDLIVGHSSAMLEMLIVGELKKAGVPVQGFFTFQGLEGGRLTRDEDVSTGHIVYRFEEEEDE